MVKNGLPPLAFFPGPHLGMWWHHETAVLGKPLCLFVEVIKILIVSEPFPRHHSSQIRLEKPPQNIAVSYTMGLLSVYVIEEHLILTPEP